MDHVVPGRPKRGVFANGMEFARWGEGPRTLLFIPGGPGNVMPLFLRNLAYPLFPLLDEGFSIWMVTRRRGMPEGHTVEDMAADYAELIRDEFGGRVDTVFGESYGGMVAQYLAANHPQAFEHMVIALAACEVAEAEAEAEYDFAVKVSEGRDEEAWSMWVDSAYPRIPFRWLTRILGGLLALVAARSYHEHHRGDFLIEGKAEVAFDSRDTLSSIEVPVLLITGGEDEIFPPELAEETASLIPDCTSKVYEGKTHAQAAMDRRLAIDVLEFAKR